jgi:hypothetical protein
LLQAAEKALASRPEARGELGWVRAELAARRAAANQIGQAISTYLMALEDLHAGNSQEAARVALKLLRLALLNDRYDEQIAAVLTQSNPGLDGKALWEGVCGEIEQRLRPDGVDSAISMLVALQTNPPASMPADTQEAIEQMLQRARQVRIDADAAAVRGALQRLREKPDDEQARQVITQLGVRAVPALREALRTALQAEQPDADQIQRLHDLVKTVAPDWPGFAPDAPADDKLKSLDLIDTQT